MLISKSKVTEKCKGLGGKARRKTEAQVGGWHQNGSWEDWLGEGRNNS